MGTTGRAWCRSLAEAIEDLSILANYLAGNIHSLPVTP